jgi:hypothetical protein
MYRRFVRLYITDDFLCGSRPSLRYASPRAIDAHMGLRHWLLPADPEQADEVVDCDDDVERKKQVTRSLGVAT